MDNKKKKTILIILGIIILIILILSIKACTKDEPLVLDDNTKTSFINANIDFNCILQNDTTLTSNKEKANSLLTETYKNQGLPIDDNSQMLFILKKYEYDLEVTEIIKSFKDKCENGKATEYYT